MKEKRVCKQYSRSFKEEAVTLVTEQDYGVQQAADSLGIRSNMLYCWKQQLEQESSSERLSEDERAELNRLRKEVKHLRTEKEILKKASAFFAQDSSYQEELQEWENTLADGLTYD